MTKLSCELEDKIQDIDKLISKHEKEKDILEASIAEIEVYINELKQEKIEIEEKLADEEAKFEPSLSDQERNLNLGGVQ